MSYSKQENAIIERANKEFNRHIRAIIFERREVKDIWSEPNEDQYEVPP